MSHSDADMMQEIEAGEAWLRRTLRDREVCDIRAVQRCVQIAVNEAWLGNHLSEATPPELVARTRAVLVRAAADRMGAHRAFGPARPWRDRAPMRGVGFLATAAALLLLVCVYEFVRPHKAPDATQRFSYADAFEEYSGSDSFETEFALLEESMDDVTYQLDAPVLPDPEEVLLEHISNRIDTLDAEPAWEEG